MSMSLFLLVLGLILLYAGAEFLIRGSAAVALRLGMTPLIVGLTVVAFGTSSPELVVSVKATLSESGALALGNVIGSNIINIGLILGLSALIRPLTIGIQVVRVQVPIMIIASLAAWLVVVDGRISRLEGLVLVLGLLAFIYGSIHLARRERTVLSEIPGIRSGTRIWLALVGIAAGLVMLVLGATLLVRSAVALATMLGVSEAMIALTIIAGGTSLPELATSAVAALRKEGDISVGNVIGSNIFNILAILGIAALVHPITVQGISTTDFLVMLGLAVLTLPLMRTGFVLQRWEGVLLLIAYGMYVWFLLS